MRALCLRSTPQERLRGALEAWLGPGKALGELWEPLGELWEVLGGLWEGLGELWEPNYINKLPINRKAAVML